VAPEAILDDGRQIGIKEKMLPDCNADDADFSILTLNLNLILNIDGL
jgi:hypothetical protein